MTFLASRIPPEATAELKNMTKLIAALVGVLLVQSSFALSQCPAEAKQNCGQNPFYILVVGFSQVCSEKFPEFALSYRIALANMVAENPKAYENIDVDAEFQEKLQVLLRETGKLSSAELRNECMQFLKIQADEKPEATKDG